MASAARGAAGPTIVTPLAVPQRIPGDLSRAIGQAVKNTEYHAK
jgi:hypothetical protein